MGRASKRKKTTTRQERLAKRPRPAAVADTQRSDVGGDQRPDGGCADGQHQWQVTLLLYYLCLRSSFSSILSSLRVSLYCNKH